MCKLLGRGERHVWAQLICTKQAFSSNTSGSDTITTQPLPRVERVYIRVQSTTAWFGSVQHCSVVIESNSGMGKVWRCKGLDLLPLLKLEQTRQVRE